MNFLCTPTLIDWLSISGKSRGIQKKLYKKVKLNFGTSVFQCIEELYHNSARIATITSRPHSHIIDPDLFIVKFDNWVLYSKDFYVYFENVIKEVGLYDYQISRLDIAKDFNRFHRGRKPANVIKGFLSGDFLKLGKSKYSVYGETNYTLTYDYLSFGRKSNPVNCYLYNKSSEMKQVKYKPHIVKKWQQAGLSSKEPVYRLEFCMKKSELNFINKDTGEDFNFNLSHIFLQDILEKLYIWMCSKYFRLKFNTGQKNISRERDLVLFQYAEFDNIIWEQVEPVETNRADKIFLKKLDTLYSELRDEDLHLFNAIETVTKSFSHKKNLRIWLKHKLRPEILDKLEHPSFYEPELKRDAMSKDFLE